ncbi:MAG: MotA/TolQ/ExbB proton channel family protein [Gemmatimonadota bacterium]
MTASLLPILHGFVQALLGPVLLTLFLSTVYLTYECGVFLREAWSRRGGRLGSAAAADHPGDLAEAHRLLADTEAGFARRLERTDILARLGPALGLAGTLIPLGPGLSGLQRGDVSVLASALTVAFDTTVLGLVVGVVAFVLSRVRRRWYESELDSLAEQWEESLPGAAANDGVGDGESGDGLRAKGST